VPDRGSREHPFQENKHDLPAGEDGSDDNSETEDETGLRRIMLKSLMEDSVAAQLLQREALRRAIVRSLIGDVGGESESQKSDRAAPNAST